MRRKLPRADYTMSAQRFAANVWAALSGHARTSLDILRGAEASIQAEQPPLRSDDAESAALPPKEPEESAVQKEEIIADPHPKTATESPSPAKPAPLEVTDDWQLVVGRDGSVPPTASELEASLRSGKDAPAPNWFAENRFGPLVALKGMGQVRSAARRQPHTYRTRLVPPQHGMLGGER